MGFSDKMEVVVDGPGEASHDGNEGISYSEAKKGRERVAKFGV